MNALCGDDGERCAKTADWRRTDGRRLARDGRSLGVPPLRWRLEECCWWPSYRRRFGRGVASDGGG